MYLELLKKCLTRLIFPDQHWLPNLQSSFPMNPAERIEGKDWPTEADTMIGLQRLGNLQACVTKVLEEDIPGDLVETGVWRGGASIFMRAVLKVYRDETRRVWLADSFQGLPVPDPGRYPRDLGDNHSNFSTYLGVSLEEVKTNFSRYGLLDESVRFLPGWFRDTLAGAPIDTISVLRLDGDMYESTIEALTSLYVKVAPRGFVIIDDYGVLPNCRAAVEDFRSSTGVTEPLNRIDWSGVFWQKGNFCADDSHEHFDEESYLRQNRDVADAVSSGAFTSGLDHFLRYGKFENRKSV